MLYEEKQKYTHKCDCGHSVFIPNRKDRAICRYCHKLIFKDKKAEFEYRMKRELIKEKRNLK